MPVIHDMPMEEYLRHPAFSKSDLKAISRSEQYALWYTAQKATQGVEEDEKDHFRFGTVAHACILENRWNDIVVAPVEDGRRKEFQAAKKRAQAGGKLFLKPSEAQPIRDMAKAVHDHMVCGLLLQDGRGKPEVTAVADLELPLRARADLVINTSVVPAADLATLPASWRESEAIILDLKTASGGDPDSFTRNLSRYGYDIGVPHYRHVFAEAMDVPVEKIAYGWIVVEKTPPFEVGLYALGQESYDVAYQRWLQCIRAWSDLRKKLIEGGIPRGYGNPGGVWILELPNWELLKGK